MTQLLQARAFAAYGRASSTLPPLQQIVMLYDGAMLRLREARAAIERGDVEARFTATTKATLILEALQSCLDHERGGEIAAALDRIYRYLILRLVAVNARNDLAACDEVLARLAELRASWAALAGQTEAASMPARERALSATA